MSKLRFFLHSIRDFKTIGSVTPSGKYLVDALIAPIDPKNARCIVELGAGEGCVTRELQKKVSDDCIILSFEIHETLLRPSDAYKKNVILIHDDAENIKKHLDLHNIKSIDYVISSLPLAQIPKEKVAKILASVKELLEPHGSYVQYQYSLLSKKTIGKHFKNIRVKFVPFNIFPAFVYICKK
jgi:phospholipid N-methyltransferase